MLADHGNRFRWVIMQKLGFVFLISQFISVGALSVSPENREADLIQVWDNYDEATGAKIAAYVSGALALGFFSMLFWRPKNKPICDSECGCFGATFSIGAAIASAASLVTWALWNSGNSAYHLTGSGNPYAPGEKEFKWGVGWDNEKRQCITNFDNCQRIEGAEGQRDFSVHFKEGESGTRLVFVVRGGAALYFPLINGSPKVGFDIEGETHRAPAALQVSPNVLPRRPASEIEQCSWLVDGQPLPCSPNENGIIYLDEPGNYSVAYNVTDNHGAQVLSSPQIVEVTEADPEMTGED